MTLRSTPMERTGIVLAGGASSRMGSFKPLLSFRGRPLLAYALDALRPHCAELLVMAGPHATEVSRIAEGARVLADPGEGPHVALRLAVQVARHPTLLVVPADSPFVGHALPPLVEVGPNAVARDGDGVNPLVGIYEHEGVQRALSSPVRSLQEVAATLRSRPVLVPAGALFDLDDPDAFDRAPSA